ncbi:hypothetical protein ALISP_3350 [Alicycliphilus sp. B1]|nr:hypothetical protein ALISP_3350 [Alicycliphilus sp. B1]
MADLTPKQQEAAALIASGKTQRQAAEAVGVSPQTLTAWSKKEDFQRHVQALLQPAHEGVQTALQGLHQRAAEVLASLLETAPPATKLQAIRLIFEINKATPPAQDAASSYEEFMKHFGQGLTHASQPKHHH